jgi:hypothetical protein
MANEIITEIILDLDKMRSRLKDAEGESKSSGEKIGKSIGDGAEGGFGKFLGGFKGQLLALGGAIAGGFTLKAMIHEATEAQDAMHQLATAFRITGQDVPSATAHFEHYAEQLQRLTTVSDDAIVKNAALLVSIGKLSGEGLDRATKAALDLSAGMNISLETAFDKVSRAAAGHTEVLRKYGITVMQTGDRAKDFSAFLDKINSSFGGQAEAKVNTFSGALAQLTNISKDLLETFGNMIIKSPVVVAMLKFAGQSTAAFNEKVKELVGSTDVIGTAIKALLQLGQYIITYVVQPLELLYNVGKVVFDALLVGIQGLVVGFSAFGYAVGSLLEKVMPEKFAGFGESMKTMLDSSVDVLNDFVGKTQEAGGKVFDFNVSAASSNYITKLQSVADQARPIADQVTSDMTTAQEAKYMAHWDYIVNGFNNAFNFTAAKSEQFQKQMQARLNTTFESFKVGVAGAFASIGAALVKGENVFAAFGKAILGVFGDLAIQIGTFYFLLGIATLFLNPAAAAGYIAGGLALIVLGGALKALAGGGGMGAGATGAGGGGAGGGGGGGQDQFTGEPLAQEDRKPQTNIAVNIAGNVLDRRQTGIEIVDSINEAFGTQGVVIVGAT